MSDEAPQPLRHLPDGWRLTLATLAIATAFLAIPVARCATACRDPLVTATMGTLMKRVSPMEAGFWAVVAVALGLTLAWGVTQLRECRWYGRCLLVGGAAMVSAVVTVGGIAIADPALGRGIYATVRDPAPLMPDTWSANAVRVNAYGSFLRLSIPTEFPVTDTSGRSILDVPAWRVADVERIVSDRLGRPWSMPMTPDVRRHLAQIHDGLAVAQGH
jgi:hypothetical protein